MSDGTGDVTEANRATIRRVFEAWRDGTGAITDVFAPGMTWRLEGRVVAGKVFADTAQFTREVLTGFAARFPADAPFRPVGIRSVIADGDTVVVVWDGRGIAHGGHVYENSYAWILRLRDGQVVDGTAFFDQLAFNDLWTKVEPRR